LRSTQIFEDQEVVDLGQTGMKVEESLRLLAYAKNIQLAVDVPPEPVMVLGDRESLEQLFLNLIGNGVKYTPSGGSVMASVCRDAHMVRIVVEDDGIGIPESEQEAVFHEFHRAPNARAEGSGSGMGLAIVKRIVEIHAGSIELESEVGKGTRFTVCLPIHKGQDQSSARIPA
jgi:signal transduction histidine kinase